MLFEHLKDLQSFIKEEEIEISGLDNDQDRPQKVPDSARVP